MSEFKQMIKNYRDITVYSTEIPHTTVFIKRMYHPFRSEIYTLERNSKWIYHKITFLGLQ